MSVQATKKIWIKKKRHINSPITKFFVTSLISHKYYKILDFFYHRTVFEIEVEKLYRLTKNIEKINNFTSIKAIKNYTDVVINRAFDILDNNRWKQFNAIAKTTDGNFDFIGLR